MEIVNAPTQTTKSNTFTLITSFSSICNLQTMTHRMQETVDKNRPQNADKYSKFNLSLHFSCKTI